MRVLLDCRAIHANMGGIGRMALELAQRIGLIPSRHNFFVLLGHATPDVQFRGVEAIKVNAAMIDERFEQFGLPSLLKNLEIELYLGTCFSIPAVKTTRLQASVIHDVVFEDHPEWVEPGLRAYLSSWSRLAAQKADAVITVSRFSKDRIASVYDVPESKITVIYNGVSLPVARGLGNTSVASQRLPQLKKYILYLGSVEAKKGVPQLLDAYKLFRSSGYSEQLVLAGGKGGGEFDLDAEISVRGLSDSVLPLGYVSESEKATLLQESSVFVYPSLYEGFGLPPLEAMALGKPTIVHDGSSLREVVGDSALRVDVTNIRAFADALKSVLYDSIQSKHLSHQGPLQAAKFSWDVAAKRYVELVDALEAA